MTDDEIEQVARQLYAQQDVPPGHAQIPWEHQTPPIRALWRDLANGDAGAAVD